VLVLAVTLLACMLTVRSRRHTWGRFVHLPKLAVLALFTLGLGGVAVSLLAGVVTKPEADRAVVAVVRTAVLAAAALGLALAGRRARTQEAAMLVYPVLLLAGAKLLFEDLRTGRPATLMFSLFLYGVALMVAPRLARRKSTEEPSAGLSAGTQ
jgi:hypothetical protein